MPCQKVSHRMVELHVNCIQPVCQPLVYLSVLFLRMVAEVGESDEEIKLWLGLEVMDKLILDFASVGDSRLFG